MHCSLRECVHTAATGLWPHHCSVWTSLWVSSSDTLASLGSALGLLCVTILVASTVSHTPHFQIIVMSPTCALLLKSLTPRTASSAGSRYPSTRRECMNFFNCDEAFVLSRYANGLVYAFSSLILGWCVDRLDWPRTWLLVAANLLLAGMYVLEVGPNTLSAHPEARLSCPNSLLSTTRCLLLATDVLLAGRYVLPALSDCTQS